MIDITSVMQALITLMALVITCVIVPYLRNKMSQDQLNTLKAWVKIAVEAAEQIYTGSGKGAEKKEYVIKFLESKGFSVNSDSIDVLIESYVKELFNYEY